ncbi:hypothetical protein L1049_015529 [Liquidambar formosana]|uniref:J domain-containing protein n=1 Tax=Liquidambar formosana TaxID=63359 RepID=A0AAP0RY15_LIQFO
MLLSTSNSFLGSSLHLSNTSIRRPSLKPAGVKFRQPHITAAHTSAGTRKTEYCHSSEMASSSSLYEVLGIPMSATGHEIKAAYRRLARVCHPDVAAMNRKETSANEFMKIHAAYSTLSDPNKRANYDQDLFRRRRPFGSVSTSPATMNSDSFSFVSGFSGYGCRNWETDQCW